MKGGYRPNSGRKKGSIPWNKGVPMKKESKEKLSKRKMGSPAWNKGIPHRQETKDKLSKVLKGRVSNWKGKVASDKSKEKMRQAKYKFYSKKIPNYLPIPRNIRLASNGGFHSNGEWENLKAQYNWTCPSCKRIEPTIKLTKDHIIPVSRGGSNNIENIQPLCMPCNRAKSTLETKY